MEECAGEESEESVAGEGRCGSAIKRYRRGEALMSSLALSSVAKRERKALDTGARASYYIVENNVSLGFGLCFSQTPLLLLLSNPADASTAPVVSYLQAFEPLNLPESL